MCFTLNYIKARDASHSRFVHCKAVGGKSCPCSPAPVDVVTTLAEKLAKMISHDLDPLFPGKVCAMSILHKDCSECRRTTQIPLQIFQSPRREVLSQLPMSLEIVAGYALVLDETSVAIGAEYFLSNTSYRVPSVFICDAAIRVL